MRIVLVGFMGSGKSTIGRIVARETARRLVETDDEVLRLTGMSTCAEVFASAGESGFRRAEYEVALSLVRIPRLVVSTGGGFVTVPGAVEALRDADDGCVVAYLSAPFESLTSRISYDDPNRPLFSSETRARALYEERLSLYREAADLTIDVDSASPENAAREIIRRTGS